MFDKIRPFFTNPPKRPNSPLGAGMSDEDEPAIPVFQQAWKQGATFEDMFGPSPFTLHGSVGRSGADNHRPDVAKVETFLGDSGYYKPLTKDGPSGWHSTNLDTAIRSFQKDHGLAVDGFLKPNGPTIGKIGGLLGGGTSPAKTAQGFWGGPNNDQPGIPDMPRAPRAPKPPIDVGTGPTVPWPKPQPQPPVDGPDLPGGDIWEKPQPPAGGQDDLEALIRIMNGGQKPSPLPVPPVIDEGGRLPPELRPKPPRGPWHEAGSPPRTPPRHPETDYFPGHTISESGAKEHDDWAKLLVRDSDPSQTARMLKVAITEYGDQGRGDVADLLGRFHQIDPAKAETLRRAVRDATGEELPFRVAPMGEGFREPTDEEKLARAPKAPFGASRGADRWAAGNMAEVLLGKGDYADAVKHFRTDRTATMPYLAAVHEQMRDKNPMQAMKFATQMRDAGLAMAADAPEPPTPPTTQAPTPTTPPPPPTTPAPVPSPETTAPPTTREPVATSAAPQSTPSTPAATADEPGEQEANAAQAARVLLNSGPVVAAGAMLQQKLEEWRKKGDKPPSEGAGTANNPQMQPAEPVPPVPGLEPPGKPQGNKTELIPPTIKLEGFGTPIPDPERPNILVFPAQPTDPREGIVENRKGSLRTQAQLGRIKEGMKNNGGEHVGGHDLPEYHVPGPGKNMPEKGKGDGRPGGGYTDLTFKMPDGSYTHIQTVDIDPRTGKPTMRELDNAERIRRLLEREGDRHQIILIPKDSKPR